MKTFLKNIFLYTKIIINKINVNLNVFKFKFKNIKNFMSIMKNYY